MNRIAADLARALRPAYTFTPILIEIVDGKEPEDAKARCEEASRQAEKAGWTGFIAVEVLYSSGRDRSDTTEAGAYEGHQNYVDYWTC